MTSRGRTAYTGCHSVSRVVLATCRCQKFWMQVTQGCKRWNFSEGSGITLHQRLIFMRPLTCDDSYVHHYTPETKRSSMEWHVKDETTPVKNKKTCLSASQVLTIVFFLCWWYCVHRFFTLTKNNECSYYSELLGKVKGCLLYTSRCV